MYIGESWARAEFSTLGKHNDRKDSFKYVLERLTAARTGTKVTEYTEELKKPVK